MSGDLNENPENRRRRPIPVPFNDDRYIERPTLRKVELAKIRDNLDELIDIKKTELFKDDKPTDNKSTSDVPNIDLKIEQEIKKDESKSNILDINIPNTTIVSPPNLDLKSIMTNTTQSIVNSESKTINSESKNNIKDDKVDDKIKIGISNLVDNSKQNNDKQNKQKVIKRKVYKMNDEEQQIINVSPEMRRQLRKAEIKEYNEEDKRNESIRKAAEIAEQNTRELKEFKLNLAKENEDIKRDLKAEISSKFGHLDQKFNDITGRFDKVSTKLEETCVGIDCLKKDLAKLNKNVDLVECPECHERVVPPLASFCPACSAQISGWTEDDGTPVKGWRPNWEK